MANLRFKRYTDKRGTPRYDPVDGDIGGLMQSHLDEAKAAGHTVEIINDRMAGEELPAGLLDDIIDSTIRSNSPSDIAEDLVLASYDDIQPGGDPRFYRENLNAVAEMNKRLVKAGIDTTALGGGTGGLHSILPTVGRLQGDVPGPYIESLKTGKERRTHLQYENVGDSDVRGVVPVMDPTNPQKVLQTYFGNKSGTPAGSFDEPSEYVGQQILRLMDKRAVLNNTTPVLDRNNNQKYYLHGPNKGEPMMKHWYSDLKDIDDKLMGNIDVERGDSSLDRETLPLQLTAALRYPDGKAVAKRGANSVLSEVTNGSGNVIDAVKNLRNNDRRVLPVEDKAYYGKAFKTPEFQSDKAEKMDRILNLMYKPGSSQLTKTVAPLDINMLNIAAAREAAQQHTGKLTSNPNKATKDTWFVDSREYPSTKGGVKVANSKVKINIPKDAVVQKNPTSGFVKAGDKVSYSVIDENPLTQQVLDQRVMNDRFVMRPSGPITLQSIRQ